MTYIVYYDNYHLFANHFTISFNYTVAKYIGVLFCGDAMVASLSKEKFTTLHSLVLAGSCINIMLCVLLAILCTKSSLKGCSYQNNHILFGVLYNTWDTYTTYVHAQVLTTLVVKFNRQLYSY